MKIKMLDKTLKIVSNRKFFNEDIYVEITEDEAITILTSNIIKGE